MITMRHFTRLRLAIGLGAALSYISAAPLFQLEAAPANPIPQVVTKDKVASRTGTFLAGGFGAKGSGHSGAAQDYAIDFTPKTPGSILVSDMSFLNSAAAADEISIAFWAKKYDIAAGSAFWAESPSSNNGQRGAQAHVPWNNNNVYFDTAGCCNGDTRISADIATFPDFTGDATDISWWTNNWHHFVFSKKGTDKQIWIDGKLFLDVPDASAPLPTDFTGLYIGSYGPANGGPLAGNFHGLMDDFSVFSKQLADTEVAKLSGGTLPSALPASDGLIAYWDFNDFPADGAFLSVTPTPNTTSGSARTIQVIHVDGATPWTSGNVSLKLDGNPVTVTFDKTGDRATVTYNSPTLLAIQSTHTATLTYPGANGSQTLEWSFTVGPYTADKVSSRLGVFQGGSGYSVAGGGHSGAATDYAVDFGKAGSGPVYVADASFFNTAAANDEISITFWAKKYDTAQGSAFWADSPGSNNSQRGAQAHVPWDNNNIYFDTAGCCNADTRINASVSDFPDWTGDFSAGDISWWTNNWHHFVFSKKGADKQIWIDGKLFLDVPDGSAALPKDFTDLYIGSSTGGGGTFHALVDDFAVFSKQLADTDVAKLSSGTLPNALPAGDGLLAYWDFNDIPPQGIFLSFSPAPDSTNAAPNRIQVVHQQGTTQWDLTKVGLKVDNNTVSVTPVRNANRVTVSYVPPDNFAIGSTHTATLSYPNPDGTISTKSWQFSVGQYTLDKVHSYVGLMLGPTKFTADGGGYSAKPGDYGMDLGKTQAGQGVRFTDPTALNAAAANDQMSVVGWQKLYSLASSAFFFGVAPSVNGGQRGWGSFPWGDSNIYFDTAGCCDGDAQRISAGISTFPGYTDATFWTNWHHFVYLKNGSDKQVWIDGQMFLEGSSTAPLPTDFTEGDWGLDVPDNARLQGILDDVAIFGTPLDQATVQKLASGTLPSALPASTKLLAYWDFNDASSGNNGGGGHPTLSVASIAGGKIRITFTGTLDSADTLTANTVWSSVANATSPWDVATDGKAKFYRAKQ
jgi:hypothetical protein